MLKFNDVMKQYMKNKWHVSKFRIVQVADPWGGSYMMESLTDELYEKARKVREKEHYVMCTYAFMKVKDFDS